MDQCSTGDSDITLGKQQSTQEGTPMSQSNIIPFPQAQKSSGQQSILDLVFLDSNLSQYPNMINVGDVRK